MTIDEFQKVDLRVGLIVSAERIEGSEKLLKFQVDAGDAEGPRQILSGIAKRYAPEELIGKKVVLVANLDPRMMMGMESKGMILAAHDALGAPVLLTPMDDVAAGEKIV